MTIQPMADPFESSRRKLAWAKKHILDFKREVETFEQKQPYTRFIEPDTERPDCIAHKIRLTEPIPECLSDIAFDVVSNLRAALDQASYAVAILSGKIKAKHTHFPFASSAADFNRSAPGLCKDLPQDIFALFCGFQPYKGGNDLLYALNRICNREKHALFTPVAVAVVRPKYKFTFPETFPYGGYVVGSSKPTWDRAKNEIMLVTVRADADAHLHYDIQFTFIVAFDEIEEIQGQEALGILNTMASIVESILLAIEAEAKRLGFVQ